MNVSLTPELEKLVNDEVKSGRYKSASEVVREGLRLIRLREAKLKSLRQDIQAAIEQADRGEIVSAKQVFADIKRRNKAIRRKK